MEFLAAIIIVCSPGVFCNFMPADAPGSAGEARTCVYVYNYPLLERDDCYTEDKLIELAVSMKPKETIRREFILK